MTPLVIAIDGPSAAGKGTLARRLAEHFGLPHLDTGLLYRAVGAKSARTGQPPAEVAKSLSSADLGDSELRTDVVGQAASRVAAIPEVRANLLEFQRNFARQAGGAVLDGRDVGTVICPEAAVKLFVTASAEARAERRFQELRARGGDIIKPRVLGGSTASGRTRCLPSRYQRHGFRRGFRRRSGFHRAQGLPILRAISRRRRIGDSKRRLRERPVAFPPAVQRQWIRRI